MVRQISVTVVACLLLFVSACGSDVEVKQDPEVSTEALDPKEEQEQQQPNDSQKEKEEQKTQAPEEEEETKQTEKKEETEKAQEQKEPVYNNLEDFVAGNYQYIETINSSVNSGDRSMVYRAESKAINEVSSEIQDHFRPREVSEVQNGKQVLIYDYPRYFIILTTDEAASSDTLVELAEHEFVRDNFSPDFFDGLFVMYILDEVLDVDDWGKKQLKRCGSGYGDCYRGFYKTGKNYKGPKSQPNFRGYSSSVRGGGPGSGK